MKELLIEIGVPILGPIIEALLISAATWVGGWIVLRYRKLTGQEMDAQSAKALHEAMARAARIGWRKYGVQLLDRRAREESVLDYAASYVERFNPGTVKRFGLSHEDLKLMGEAHLPDLSGR